MKGVQKAKTFNSLTFTLIIFSCFEKKKKIREGEGGWEGEKKNINMRLVASHTWIEPET